MRCCRRGAGRRLAEWIAQLRSSGATRTPRALRARWIRCCTIIRSDGKRQPLAIHRRPRFKGRWEVLLFGCDDGGLLPTVVRGAAAAARECALPCEPEGRRDSWISSLQAL